MAKRYFNFSKDGFVERITGRGRVTEAFITYDSTISNPGGLTTIAIDGELSGTYNNSVLCLGDVDLTGPITVYGDLTVLGNLAGADGHGIVIYGNMNTDSMELIPHTGTLGQDLIRVYGSWTIRDSIRVDSYGGDTAEIYVHGDMIGQNYIFMEGGYGSPGGTLVVHGDLIAEDVDVSGAHDNPELELSATNGGSVVVYGDLVIDSDVDVSGGWMNWLAGPAGNGGTITVRGNLFCGSDIFAGGGEATAGNGGNGGEINVEGDVIVFDEFEFFGGYSASAGNGGNGGVVDIRGNYIHRDDDSQYTKGQGGTAIAGTGGAGGLFTTHGASTLYGITLNGGGGSVQNGGCGTATFESGVTAQYIELRDGDGGESLAPTSPGGIFLGGYNTIIDLDVVDRADVLITSTARSAVLRVANLAGRDTLTARNGALSNPIADATEMLFYSNAAGQWSAMSGSGIMAP